jgi:hypothetical protein
VQEIAAKEERRAGLRRILTETDAPDYEVQRLTEEIAAVSRQISAITDRRAAAMQAYAHTPSLCLTVSCSYPLVRRASGEDSKLGIFRQQAGFVAQKKADVAAKLAAARGARQKLEAEMAEKEKYMSSFRGSKVRASRALSLSLSLSLVPC